MRQFFGSMETLCNRNRSGGFLTPLPRNAISKSAGRKFSTVHKVDNKMSQRVDIEVSNMDRSISKTLNQEEMMKMEFYSKFSPTSVTLSHFLDHSSGGGTVEDSFLFLRREIPVRLANMMMELEAGPRVVSLSPNCFLLRSCHQNSSISRPVRRSSLSTARASRMSSPSRTSPTIRSLTRCSTRC